MKKLMMIVAMVGVIGMAGTAAADIRQDESTHSVGWSSQYGSNVGFWPGSEALTPGPGDNQYTLGGPVIWTPGLTGSFDVEATWAAGHGSHGINTDYYFRSDGTAGSEVHIVGPIQQANMASGNWPGGPPARFSGFYDLGTFALNPSSTFRITADTNLTNCMWRFSDPAAVVQDESVNATGTAPIPNAVYEEPDTGDDAYGLDNTGGGSIIWTPGLAGKFDVNTSWATYSSHCTDATYYFRPDGTAGSETLIVGGINQQYLADQVTGWGTVGQAAWSDFYGLGTFDLTAASTFRIDKGTGGNLTTGVWEFTPVAAPIPEPAGLGLIGLALLALRKRRRTMKTLMMIVAMVGVIAMAGTAEAVVYNFTGGTTDWNTAGNWSAAPPNLPSFHGGEDITVLGAQSTAAGVFVEIGTAGAGTTTFTINTSGTLAFNANGPWYGRGVLTVIDHINGTVNTEGSCVGRGPVGTSTTYNMSGGAFNLTGFLIVGEQAAVSLFDQTDGAVTVGSYGLNDYLGIGATVNAAATYQISGGSLEVNATNLTQNGGMNIGGWWYGGAVPANLYDGGAGLFEVVGTGPSSITVNGQLCVSGNAAGGGKGTLQFTMGAGGVTPMTVNGTVRATIAATWAGDGRGDGDLVIDMTGLGGGVGDILLIDNDGADAIVGTFFNAPEGTVYGSHTLSYLGFDGLGNDLVLLAPPIPEPAGLGLIGLALLAVRKKRS